MDISDVNCPLCNASNVRILFRNVKDYECHTIGAWDLLFCNYCKLSFLHPMLNIDEAISNYSKDYVLYELRKGWITRLFYQFYIRYWAKNIKSLIGDKGKILEVGCGSGEAIKSLSKLGCWDIVGLDSVKHSVEAGSKIGVKIYEGTLESFSKETDETYDLIIMLQVIEHVPDPKSDIKHAFNLLKPGGYLIGETQNVMSWDSKLLGRYWGFLAPPRHLFSFSAESLTGCVRESGFASVDIKHSPNPAGWALGLQFFIQDKLLKKGIIGRASYYPLLLILFIPVAIIQYYFKSSGIIEFFASRNK